VCVPSPSPSNFAEDRHTVSADVYASDWSVPFAPGVLSAVAYRGGHITVDLIWANVGPKYQRWIDVFATLVLLFVVTVQTWTLFDKVRGTYNDNVLTFEMHMPTWPFFAIAWAGDVSAVLLIAIRTYRLVFHPEDIHDAKATTVE
jgi:TRAP-type C4-dicarboxylate transport system permease small subunit